MSSQRLSTYHIIFYRNVSLKSEICVFTGNSTSILSFYCRTRYLHA
jgi:hypothetical protein